MTPIFITGIGTGIGKTVTAAIITEALEADYWKPVQSGFPTDSDTIKSFVSNTVTKVYKEAYLLDFPASPHISAPMQGINISLDKIMDAFPVTHNQLIIEGAGGILVPLNDHEFMLDLVKKMKAKVLLVSNNYLGSINHSLMTAQVLLSANIPVIGWIFNGEYLDYEDDIVKWTNLPKIASIKRLENIDKNSIRQQASIIGPSIKRYI